MPILAPAWWWAFAPGMVLALVERDRPDLLRPRPLAVVGALTLATGMVLLDRWPAGVADAMRAGPIVLGAVGIMGASVGWRPTVGASSAAVAAEVSYPFYLWHAPVLAAFAPLGSGYAVLAVAFVATLAASTASVLVAERPFRRAFARSRSRGRGRAMRSESPENIVGPASRRVASQVGQRRVSG